MAGRGGDSSTVGVMVAHPDDETLWAGGTLLMHPKWQCSIFTLCRGGDPDRAPRFREVLQRFGAAGRMADLEDGPQQAPLELALVRQTVAALLGDASYDLLLTHGPDGEYTRHCRHREVFAAVADLWRAGEIDAHELWLFAYEDGGGAYLPRAIEGAPLRFALPQAMWAEKYEIIHHLYGYSPDSWEARTTPQVEAFWRVQSSERLPTSSRNEGEQG